jgi:hypothetical protein
MKSNKFNEDFFANVREMEIWKRLSEDRDFTWSETLIDRYQDKLDWKSLSENGNVQWTASMLEKYKHKIDWKALSAKNDYSNQNLSSRGCFSSENLRKFSSKWDWSALSANSSVGWTMGKVEEFKDFIDWSGIIDLGWNERLYTLEFFEKYKDYFPVSSLQQSQMWSTIMDISKGKLIEEILAQ